MLYIYIPNNYKYILYIYNIHKYIINPYTVTFELGYISFLFTTHNVMFCFYVLIWKQSFVFSEDFCLKSGSSLTTERLLIEAALAWPSCTGGTKTHICNSLFFR